VTQVLNGLESLIINSDTMTGYIISGIESLVNASVSLLPNLIGATVVWIAGMILAWIFAKVTKEILLRLHVDRRLHLPTKGIFSTAEIFPAVVFWSIFLVGVQQGLDQLGLSVLSDFFGQVVSFLGGLVEALVVIIVGYALTDYVSRSIRETKKPFAELIANVVFFLMMYIVVAIALPFVGIETTLINAILIIILGSIGLGLAIAIGLGLKDTIARLAKKYEKEFAKK